MHKDFHSQFLFDAMHVPAFALKQLPLRCAGLVRPCLAAVHAMCLLGGALPCHAANATMVVNGILTSRFLEQERCDNLGLISAQLLQNLNSGVGVNQRPELSHQQVREIATRYVEINEQLCDAITPVLSGTDAWARVYDKYAGSTLSDKAWARFLADERAMKWAAITAQFRTELIALNSAINLAMALRPDAFNPDAKRLHNLHLPETRKLLADIRRVSLTDEEAKVRFALASLHDQPAFREMLPARFNVVRLAGIEARTREIGLHLVNKHEVHLEDLYNARTRMLLFTRENDALELKLDATIRTATTQIKALVSKYR
ncbi:hypothetical protein [Massilia consociata]|uniref:Uncharacterized protein n=1 Tax=Massilia consociata TaxID=760117 RepID=A0ABV6FAY9_9BURK